MPHIYLSRKGNLLQKTDRFKKNIDMDESREFCLMQLAAVYKRP
jgi:hypothetical protein